LPASLVSYLGMSLLSNAAQCIVMDTSVAKLPNKLLVIVLAIINATYCYLKLCDYWSSKAVN